MSEAFAVLSFIFAPLIFLFSLGLTKSLEKVDVEAEKLDENNTYSYVFKPKQLPEISQALISASTSSSAQRRTAKTTAKSPSKDSIDEDIRELEEMIKKYKDMAHGFVNLLLL